LPIGSPFTTLDPTDMSRVVPGGGNWKADSDPLRRQIQTLSQQYDDVDYTYSGLIDLDLTFDLIESRLNLALLLTTHEDRRDERQKSDEARRAAVSAVLDLERLSSSHVSVDQAGFVSDDPRMEKVRELMARLLASGGGPLFTAEPDPGKARRLVRALTAALLKHAGKRDEDLEPGDEDLIFSEAITLPASQAALLVREEFIPAVEKQLDLEPGSRELQQRLHQLTRQAEILENARYFPRARPAEMEPGLLTDTMVGFTPTGEAVVSMRIPVISETGNRHERIREQVETHVLRSIAGRGLSRKLDEMADAARSVSGGRRGSPDDSLASLRVGEAFREVATGFPFLSRLENPETLARLVDLAENGRQADLRRYLEAAAVSDITFLSSRIQQLLDGPT